MDSFKVDKDSTLSAYEFYERFKVEDKELNIFEKEDEDDDHEEKQKEEQESFGEKTKEHEQRPITPIDQAIKHPPTSHEELTKCFRERLILRDDLKNLSVEDQTQLADVITLAIVSLWPEHRRQAPDPFLSELGNKELQRRVAAHVVEASEELFYDYIKKAKDLNEKAVFSSGANLCRLKTQILYEANKSLNVLNIRRKLAEEMRQIPDEKWFAPLASSDLFSLSSMNKNSTSSQDQMYDSNIHDQFVYNQLHELSKQMPTVDASKINDLSFDHTFTTITPVQTSSVSMEKESSLISNSTACNLSNTTVEDNYQHTIKRSDSMPDITDQSELADEFKLMLKDHKLNRKISLSQMFLNGSYNDFTTSNEYQNKHQEDLQKLVYNNRENAIDNDKRLREDDFSPLLQASSKPVVRRRRRRREEENHTIETNKDINNENFDELDKDVIIIPQCKHEQPKVVNVKVPQKSIVRISDVKVSNLIEETKLTLHMHPTIYNAFLNEIDEETVKSLDQHLFTGEEITDVYDEITKTLSKSYLDFDKDDFVEPCAPSLVDSSALFVSGMLLNKPKINAINETLKKELLPPWSEYNSAQEWKNEPKFAGIGREEILKIDMKRASIHSSRFSTLFQNNDFTSINKLIKSYSSWLSWYKTNITTDDYKKFLSNMETDFLSQIYHLYDSDDDDDDVEDEKKTAAELEIMREREKQKKKLRGEKSKYEKGYWNTQSVLLGGLGKDPSSSNLEPNDGNTDNNNNNDSDQNGQINKVPSHITFMQERLEHVWTLLKMPDQLRLSMAIKYSSLDTIDILNEIIELWEHASTLIVEREAYMTKLEYFEKSASDPNRFFEKGPNGSSVARINESKTRDKLSTHIHLLDEQIKPLLNVMRKKFGDHVTYKGRDYSQKMQTDRIEMLYWLQQERRKRTLQIQPTHQSLGRVNTPIKCIELNSQS